MAEATNGKRLEDKIRLTFIILALPVIGWMVNELRSQAADLSQVRVDVAQNYMQRTQHDRDIDAIIRANSKEHDEIKSMLREAIRR